MPLLAVKSVYLIKSFIFSVTPTVSKIPIFRMIGDFIRKLQKRNLTELEDDGS